MIDFLINRSVRSGQHRRADCLAPLSARLCLAQVHISDNTGRFRDYDHTIRNHRFQNIVLRHKRRVHICISKSNYRKISCLGEDNTQGTSIP